MNRASLTEKHMKANGWDESSELSNSNRSVSDVTMRNDREDNVQDVSIAVLIEERWERQET
jgi:hypothetical protein